MSIDLQAPVYLSSLPSFSISHSLQLDIGAIAILTAAMTTTHRCSEGRTHDNHSSTSEEGRARCRPPARDRTSGCDAGPILSTLSLLLTLWASLSTAMMVMAEKELNGHLHNATGNSCLSGRFFISVTFLGTIGGGVLKTLACPYFSERARVQISSRDTFCMWHLLAWLHGGFLRAYGFLSLP